MTETDRRAEERQDLRRIFDSVDGIRADIAGFRADFRVHVTKHEAVAEKVAEHGRKIEQFEKIKDKGALYIILGWLAAGGMGGGAAHIARKWLE